MEEAEFRKAVQVMLDVIERGFREVDPDAAECEQAFGAMTIVFGDGSRCILSTQPSIRQIWLAVASKGVAFHFKFDSESGRWLDDKDRGVELLDYLRCLTAEMTGMEINF
jgi:CyaY protein